MKTRAAATKSMRSPAGSADVQPLFGASLIAISSAARATEPRASEVTSKFRSRPKDMESFGKETDANEAARMPGKTFMRNNQGQEYVSVIQPPTMGPTVGARTAKTPATMVASGCVRVGNSRKTAEKTTGIRIPPEKPCRTRYAIKDAKL